MPETITPTPDRTAPARGHRPPTGPRTLALGVGCALAAAAIGAAVATEAGHPALQAIDDGWLHLMGGPHRGALRAAAGLLDLFGGPPGIVVPLALLAVLLVRRRWWSTLYFLTAYVGGSMVVVQVLKHAVDRPRPSAPLVRVDHGSFPSGHSFGAALLTVLVGALFVTPAHRRPWWLFGGCFTAAMMWSRTWLHAHWLSDTAAGAAAGAATALLLWCAFAPLLRREARPAKGAAG
ncbi:phosphatase PAP2 family protein [Kitasatospora sp. NPDC049258]|uniref:phosphatase PAP2 family protein n=1 Tax=Kitasatospora sp. NPDC049258 TaxID=3155394 RepID=UPI00341D9C60